MRHISGADEPNVRLRDFARASAMSSFVSFAGTDGRTETMNGPFVISVTGAMQDSSAYQPGRKRSRSRITPL